MHYLPREIDLDDQEVHHTLADVQVGNGIHSPCREGKGNIHSQRHKVVLLLSFFGVGNTEVDCMQGRRRVEDSMDRNRNSKEEEDNHTPLQ